MGATEGFITFMGSFLCKFKIKLCVLSSTFKIELTYRYICVVLNYDPNVPKLSQAVTKNYHKTACSVLQFTHLDILISIYSHIQDAWFVEFSALSFSYIQIHFSYFDIHTNVPSHICISYNQGVPVLPNTSFVFPCFVTPSRMFLVLSVPVLRRYHLSSKRQP